MIRSLNFFTPIEQNTVIEPNCVYPGMDIQKYSDKYFRV